MQLWIKGNLGGIIVQQAFFSIKETEKIISKGLLIVMFMLKYFLSILKCGVIPLFSNPTHSSETIHTVHR